MRLVRATVAAVLSFLFLLNADAFAVTGRWVSHGPYGSGGSDWARFLFHPVDPNFVLVSIPNGGVWKSTTGGATWRKTSFLKNPSKDSLGPFLAVHPRKPSRILALLYLSPHFGVFVTTDRGEHWVQIHNSFDENVDYPTGLTDVEFHSQNPDILYTAYTRKGIYKSTDGGKSWTAINSGLPALDCFDLAVDPQNGEILYTILMDGRVFKSTNGGGSWRSSNQGMSLEFGGVIASDPKNPATLYAGGDPGIFKTTDAGTTWAKLPCACYPISLVVDPWNPANIYYSDRSHYQGYRIFRSSDGGKSWVMLSKQSKVRAYVSIVVSPLKHNVLLLEDDEGISRSVNFGKTWQDSNTGLNNVDVFRVYDGARKLFAVRRHRLGGLGLVYASADKGLTWSVTLRTTFPVFDIEISPVDPSFIVAAGDGVCVSEDAGEHWRCKELAVSAYRVGLHPLHRNIIYLPFQKSTDTGRTWGDVYSPDPNPSSAYVDPSDGNNLYVTASFGHMYQSTDAGTHWKTIGRGLDNDWQIDVLFDPRNSKIMYTASSSGVWRSTNAGGDWTLMNNGLPSGDCCLGSLLSPADTPDVLYMAVRFNRIFKSTNGTEKWVPFPSKGLESVYVTGLAADRTGSELFVATNSGVFRFVQNPASIAATP